MSLVGISNFHYAPLTTDTKTGVTYGTPVAVPGLVAVDIKTGASSGTLFADNGPYETATTLGDGTITIETADLDLETQAALLGHTVVKGVMTQKSTDKAPYVAVMFEALKANDTVRYAKLLKVKFQVPDESVKTKDDKITFQTSKIEGKIVVRKFDKQWKRTADEDAEGYEATTGANWYTAVEPSA